MQAGRLDRRIELLKRSETRSPTTNEQIDSWPVIASVWASVLDVLPSRAERMTDAINVARRPCRIRMRWRDDVTPDMRVRVDGRVLQIVAGPAQLGRREGLEIMAEEISGQGAAA